MAIIYSYPEIPDVQGGDLLLISDTGAPNKPTRSVDIDDLAAYIGTVVGVVQNLQSVLTVGNTYVSPDGYGTFTLNNIADNNGDIKYVNTDEGWGYFLNAEEGLFFTDGTGGQTGRTGIGLDTVFIGNSNHIGIIRSANITADRTYELPNASGTIALTSDIPTPGPSGSGTTNYTARWTSASTLGIGALYDNGTNVGIGTANPTQKLEVNGTVLLSTLPNNNGRLCLGSVSTNLFSNAVSGHLYVSTNGSTRMTILNNGNVGIGTTSPSSKLHLEDSISNGSVFKITTSTSGTLQPVFDARISSNGDTYYDLNAYKSATKKIQIKSANTSYIQQVDGTGGFDIKGHLKTSLQTVNGGGVLQLHRYGALSLNDDASYTHQPASALYINTLYNTSTDYLMLLANQGSDKLAVDLNGNLGIGTSSPGRALDIVAGNGSQFRVSSTTANNTLKNAYHQVRHYNNSEQDFVWALAQSNSSVNNLHLGGSSSLGNAATSIAFFTASNNTTTTGSQRMTISNSGNVGIGTTSPSQKLEVAGNVKLDGDNRHIFFGGNNTFIGERSNSTELELRGGGNSTVQTVYIDNTGQIGVGTNNPSQKLEVAGNILVNGSNDSADGLHLKDRTFIAFSDAGSVVSRFRSSAAGVFQFQDGSYNTNVVLNNNGNSYFNGGKVGIGTTSPSEKLHVVGNTKIEGVVIVNSVNSSIYIGNSSTGQSSTSTGDRNVVIGPSAFTSNTSARYNTAVGHSAMQYTTTGDFNSVLGNQALRDNIDGSFNVAVGSQSLAFNTNSSNNTAVGYRALYQAQSRSNTGIGKEALGSLQSSTSSNDNTGIGQGVLNKITSGQRNVGVGHAAGQKYGGGNNNVVTANDSVFIGAYSDAGGDNQTNQIVIGYNAIGLGSNTAVLGNNSIATTQLKGNVGIGTTSPSAKLHVVRTIDADGSLEDNLQLKVENTIEDRPSGIEFRSNRNGTSSDSAAIVYTTTTATTNTRQIHLIPEIGVSGDLSNSSLIAKAGGQVKVGNSTYAAQALEISGTSVRLDSGSGGDFTFEHPRNGNVFFQVNNQTTLTLDKNNGGKVGIGTTAPTTKLQVNGDVRIYDENELYFGGTGSVPHWEITASGSDLIVNDTGTNVGSVLFNNDEGVALPRLTTTEINAISSPIEGLMAYNTTLNTICFYNGSSWQKVSHANM
jgi:hypothetical protein